MTTIYLKPHKEESLKRFHPWVFSGAIARVVLDASHKGDAPEEGELVCVRSAANEVLGVGHWQVGSIAVRILAFGEEELPKDFWHERIRAAYQVRNAIGLIRPDNDTFRLIHGEGDFLPGLIVDVYADTAVVQAHSVGMHCNRMDIADALMRVMGDRIKGIYYKSETTLPFKADIDRGNGYIMGGPTDDTPLEYGMKMPVDWISGQKTGLFIDQRENRALLERYSKGRSVLNMFCYTGGFSLAALRGGAKLVTRLTVRHVPLNSPLAEWRIISPAIPVMRLLPRMLSSIWSAWIPSMT